MTAPTVLFRIDERPHLDDVLELLDRDPAPTVWNHPEWLRYSLAYTGGRDCSFAIRRPDGTMVAFQPAILQADGQFRFAAHGTPGMVIDKHLSGSEIDLLRRMVEWQFEGYARTLYAASILHTHLAGEHAPVWESTRPDVFNASFRTRVVNLAREFDGDLWKDVRDSYRPLITRAKRNGVEVVAGQSLFPAYKLAHWKMVANADGKHRPQATYDLQEAWLGTGYGRLYAAVQDGRAQAFAYWVVYKSHAYYFSGAQETPDLQHALIWESMRDLKSRGVILCELGWQGKATTPKEEHVEFFKRGFGGVDWWYWGTERFFCTTLQGGAA